MPVSWRTPVVTAVGLAIVAAAVAGGWAWTTSRARSTLPALPDLTGRPPALAAHLREADEAARRAPSSAEAVGRLCTAYHADQLFDQARACYARVRALDGDWRWDYADALIDIELGGTPDLAARLRAIGMRAPTFGPVWLRLGDAEFKAGRYDEAADAWRHVPDLPAVETSDHASPPHLAEVPLAAYASLGLARIDLARNDAAAARDRLERVADAAPAFGPALRLLADSYRGLGRETDAERALYRANRLPPFAPFVDPVVDALTRESRNSTLLLRVASEATLTVNAAWSEYLTRRAVEFDPGNLDAVLKLARVLRTLDRNEEALGYFQKYAAKVPGDYLALAHIGSCLSALGRYDEAETYLRRSLAGLDDATTHYNLGLLLGSTGRLADAEREYRRAIAINPAQTDARGNLPPLLVRLGRVDEAAKELRRLVAEDPENARALANLGIVLLQQGSRDEGRLYLREALRIEPRMGQAREALAQLEGAP
jgi:tetratricopeptide (TPR) repeat protein